MPGGLGDEPGCAGPIHPPRGLLGQLSVDQPGTGFWKLIPVRATGRNRSGSLSAARREGEVTGTLEPEVALLRGVPLRSGCRAHWHSQASCPA